MSGTAAFGLRSREVFGFPGADRGDSLADRYFQPPFGTSVVLEIGKRDAGEPFSYRPLDRAKIIFLVWRDECERVSDRFGASGAAHTMDVILRHLGHVEIHDVS